MNKKGSAHLEYWIVIIFISAVAIWMIVESNNFENKSESLQNEVASLTAKQNQPMLYTEVIYFAENIDDSSETIFDYFIYNFGNTQADNVNVSCYVLDDDSNILNSQEFKIGSLASKSSLWKESIMDYESNNDQSEFGACVAQCEGCISLEYEIPEIRERHGK